MLTHPLTLATLALLALCTAFIGVYRLARRLDNYGIVDVAWSYAFAPLALFYALTASGWSPRRTLLAVLVSLWSVRLGTHLFVRVRHHHPEEDRRYQELRRRWSANFASAMFRFFQWQAVSVVVLGIPFLLIALNPSTHFHLLELCGASLWLIAISCEALADAQLAAFKRNPANSGRVCTSGLWRYSRHPNYFFEWLVWISFALLAWSAPWGWLGVLSPLVILFLLLKVTGIPMAEEQSLRSRGDAFRRYQASTSAFIPWFPKKPDVSP